MRQTSPSIAASSYLELIAAHRQNFGDRSSVARLPGRFSDFRQAIRRVRPSQLLPELAVLGLAHEKKSRGYDPALLPAVPPWAIATAARESILFGNEYRRSGVSVDDLRRIFNAHSNIYDGSAAPGSFPSGVHALLTRMAYEQFPYQESIFEEVSRTHSLLVDGLNSIQTEVPRATLQNALGSSVGEFVGATFFLQVAANENAGWFDPQWLERHDLAPVFDLWPKEVIDRRARDLSFNLDKFKAAYHAARKPPTGQERYAYNPLVERPFVRMPNGRLLAPQPKLILRTVSPGRLFYLGKGAFGLPFTRDLGQLTEWYVGQQLSFKNAKLYPEIAYGPSNSMKSIDWFLVLPSVVVLFEVKSTRFGLLERAATEGFEEAPVELLNKALKQLVRTSTEIDNDNPQFAHIPADRPRIGVIVTAEPYYLANSPFMRSRLQEAAFPTLVASVRDIEQLARLPLHDVERQIVAIAHDDDRSTWNLGNALDTSTAGPNVLLERAWESYPWPTVPGGDVD